MDWIGFLIWVSNFGFRCESLSYDFRVEAPVERVVVAEERLEEYITGGSVNAVDLELVMIAL